MTLTGYNYPGLENQYNWTVEKYHDLIEKGVLTKEDRVELLFGKIVQMSPIGRLHAACVRKVARFFARHLLEQYELSQENPIVLPDHSEPEPDFVIADLKSDSYASGHPEPKDIHLIVEVADHTVEKDRGIKLMVYASAGIREYWIINLIERQLEQHLEPAADGTYQINNIFSEGDHFSCHLIDSIKFNEFLP